MSLSEEQAIDLIKGLLKEIDELESEPIYGEKHMAWMQTSLFNISMIFGKKSSVLHNLNNVSYSHTGTGFGRNEETPRAALERLNQEAYTKGLDRAKGILSSALKLIETWGLQELQEKTIAERGGKVFISHGGETRSLRKIETFVRSLGLNPIIVEEQPSGGKSVDPKIDDYLRECDCAIVLATADDRVNGNYQPRQNVIHEIGKAQEVLKDRLIYLLEENCKFPSNIDEKVYQRFSQNDLSPAFEKIVRELKAFGLLSPSMPN